MASTLDDLTDIPSGVYKRIKQKFVNFNKPDAEFADLPYEAQAAAIERRQKLADLLQQQSRSPIEIQSYKGIQAPISTAAGLSKILDSAMAGYEEGDTARQAREAAKSQEADTKYTLGEVEKATSPAYRTTPVTSGTLADIPGASTSAGDITAMPAGTAMPDTSGYDAQAEMAKIPSAFGNRQALDSGYTGISGQSVQQGSRQDLAKALLGSRISSLRNAGLTMASTPEKLYEIGRGGKLVTGTGEVRGVGAPPATPNKTPFAAIGKNGKPGMFVYDDAGNIVAVPGMTPFRQGGGDNAPSGYRPNGRGGLEAIPGGPGDLRNTAQGFGQENALRDEYQKGANLFNVTNDAYSKVSSVPASPAGDLSMLYNYMKMLDPNSVVRESEFRVAATARPLLENLGLSWDRINSVWAGRGMTTGQREDFKRSAEGVYNSALSNQAQRDTQYTNLANSYGLDPNRVVTGSARYKKDPIASAKAAIAAGADKNAVIKRLKDAGIDTRGL
jgi:hypothetical protein